MHRIVTGDKKWMHYDNLKRRKSRGKLGHVSTSSVKPNNHGSKLLLFIWWDQQGVIYYDLLKTNETITGDRYRLQLMRELIQRPINFISSQAKHCAQCSVKCMSSARLLIGISGRFSPQEKQLLKFLHSFLRVELSTTNSPHSN